MAQEFIGIITEIKELKSGISKAKGTPWNSQDFIVETIEQYPQRAIFSLFGDKTDLLQNIEINQPVTVKFNLSLNVFTTEKGTFESNKLNVWAIETNGGKKSEVKKESATKKEVVKVEEANDFPDVNGQGAEDDLPF